MPRYTRDTERFLAYGRVILGEAEYDYIPCAYCGAPATDREHVFPQSAAFASTGDAFTMPTRRIIVPACRECNVLAGRKVFDGIEAKREYIRSQLRRRYRKYLDMPHWTEEELVTLSTQLASYVRRSLRMKAILQRRVRWTGKSFV